MTPTRISFYGYIFTGFAFLMPVIGHAQAAAPPAPAAPSAFAQLLAQYLPLILLAIATFLSATVLPYARTALQGWSTSATASAAQKEAAAFLLPVEHLAETIASGMVHDMNAAKVAGTPLDPKQVLADGVTNFKAAIGSEGLTDLGDIIGPVGAAGEKYLSDLLKKKLVPAQLAAATSSQAVAVAAASSTPLPAVAKALAGA